ncbi:MAG TPA: flagellar brake protein [Thermodesulfovibrionia bacterium]|nr:flagellar brake protein [Thermodesulfovibrionia bacterium]
MTSKRIRMIEAVDFQFSVGQTFYLEIGNFGEKKLKTTLVGWENGVFLLHRLHSFDADLMKIKDNKCMARFFDEGKVYRFDTKTLKVESYPSYLLYLKYPEKIWSVSYRKSTRYRTSIKGRLNVLSLNQTVDCKVMDISYEGCGIVVPSDIKIEVNDEMLLELEDDICGHIGGIRIAKRHVEIIEASQTMGCAIVSFEKQSDRQAFNELLSYYASFLEAFERYKVQGKQL